MTVDEVKHAINALENACKNAGITQFNRFYYQYDQVIFNVTYQGHKATAFIQDDKLILQKSDKKVVDNNPR